MAPPIGRSPPLLRSKSIVNAQQQDLSSQQPEDIYETNESASSTAADKEQQMEALLINTEATSEAASVEDMQRRLLHLEQILIETTTELKESKRQYEQLQLSSQEPAKKVSDHNLNFLQTPNISAIDLVNTTNREHSNIHIWPPKTTNVMTPIDHTIPISAPSMNAVPTLYSTFAPITNNFVPPFSCNSQQHQILSNENAPSSSVMMMPRKAQDLPDFSGEPENWPLFYTAFTQSTAAYGYTNFENNQRLQKCLKGEAKEIIKSLLIHPDNVNVIIEQLKFRFGRPEQLIHSQLRLIREQPYISEHTIVKLVPFATKVKNLSVFLQSVDGQQHIANPTLLEELVKKLPMSKRLEWAKVAMKIKPYPTISHFSEWLDEMANLICIVQDVSQTSESKNSESKNRVLHAIEKREQCLICKGNHRIYNCPKFLNMNIEERWTLVKKNRACFSCLNIGHTTRECNRKRVCLKDGCQKKHNKLLHTEPHESLSTQPIFSKEVNKKVLSCSSSDRKLLFRIIPVTLYGENCQINIYALFDDGSSITMLDKEIADQIGVCGKDNYLNIQWFGGRSAREPSKNFNIRISGVNKKKIHLLKNVYAVSNLNLPKQSLSEYEINDKFKHLPENAIKPYTNVVPKLLIGLDHANLGLSSNLYKNNENGPFASNTELGWVVFGPCESLVSPKKSCLFVNVELEQNIEEMVRYHFNVESMGVRAAPLVESDEDIRAKQILKETTKRIGNRFQTGLLWKNDDVKLPNSYPLALSRLEGIEKKMKRDENFAETYKEIIQNYIKKGYLRKISRNEINNRSDKKWYLPHFGIINPNKETKKMRLVFDAAAKVSGISLNDNLLKGPQDISSLVSTLYNFRTGKFAVGADICEMFHQVLIQPEDRISQRVLWRDGNQDLSPEEYEMTVMIFGAACSPCSALYVMKTNAREQVQFHPRALEAICEHHYMDDFVDSFDSIEEAIEISKQVKQLHKNGGFDLRKFISNCPEVVQALDGSSTAKNIPATDSTEKVLGLYWDPVEDVFMFNLKFRKVEQEVISGIKKPTKRQVLSIIMSTFDPLGFLSNYIVGGKLLLRRIWRREVRWDEPIPDDIKVWWEIWRKQMEHLVNFRIPRFYFQSGMPRDIQLHIFVDASEEAFAAVAYWRFVSVNDTIGVSFICSKTKCAPLTKVSIPRLELQAAVLGTRLRQNVLNAHKLLPKCVVLWSDSKTVLKWIGSSHRNYKPYVAHRIAEILETTKVTEWRWIPTLENVADDATRCNKKVDFSLSSRWLNGPKFLKQNENEWPEFDVILNSKTYETYDEEAHSKVLLIHDKIQLINVKRFSSYNRLKRSVAHVIRFICLCRKRVNEFDLYGITARDLEIAENIIFKQTQSESFGDDIRLIQNGQPIGKGNKLINLLPYIDDDGIMKAKGRIDAGSYLPYSTKRPIILPKNNYLTKLLVMHYHCAMKHQNQEATICNIRKKFWIPQLRCLLRSVISNCFTCRRNKAFPITPLMGPLPIDRLEPFVPPFKYTGLDYFGPINVTIGRRTEKRWVALFTCLTIRAIHLEIAHDLSTDSCIIAIKNFMNRRGIPARIRSDNGKNFIGASQEAKRFSEVFEAERIQCELSTKGVEWLFNCPVNPSEGGVWERMVQCVKRVLRQTMKNESPKEHILHSFLIKAENIVNSRPLTHLPISPHDEEPLTPNHFLLGSPNAPTTPVVNSPEEKLFSPRKQWRIAKCLRDRFWKRWVLEYLPTLTRRVKWCEYTKPIKEGNVVFICDPNLPRNQWRKGMVTRTYAGSDGVIRKVDVKTTTGELQRAVSKLAVLDLENSEADRSTGVAMSQNDLL